MNVLVIPEDFRKDQYILKPLFRRLFQDLGRPSARVAVCQDPLLGGIGEALKSERLVEIVERYDGMTDLFILCVDRDGEMHRRRRWSTRRRSDEKLTRISHQPPAADADLTAAAALNAAKVLDVLSSTTARPDSRSPCRLPPSPRPRFVPW